MNHHCVWMKHYFSFYDAGMFVFLFLSYLSARKVPRAVESRWGSHRVYSQTFIFRQSELWTTAADSKRRQPNTNNDLLDLWRCCVVMYFPTQDPLYYYFVTATATIDFIFLLWLFKKSPHTVSYHLHIYKPTSLQAHRAQLNVSVSILPRLMYLFRNQTAIPLRAVCHLHPATKRTAAKTPFSEPHAWFLLFRCWWDVFALWGHVVLQCCFPIPCC